MSLRKAIGAVKDRTSIHLAKVSSTLSPELEVAIVKATGHDKNPADEKHIRAVLNMVPISKGYVYATVRTISKRLGKTKDWIVALKVLVLVHRILSEGDPMFQIELMYAKRKGNRVLNLALFKDEAHSNSCDQSAFVRAYALYLDQKLGMLIYERKSRGDSRVGGGEGIGDERISSNKEDKEERRATTLLKEMKPDRIFEKIDHFKKVLDKFISCRPIGSAMNNKMILIALYLIVKESFQYYMDICEVLTILLDKFHGMKYQDCVKAFEVYATTAKQIDKLVVFYNWCKEAGVARSSEYPEVQKISNELLQKLSESVKDRSERTKNPQKKTGIALVVQEDEPVLNMNENYTPPLPPPPKEVPKPHEPEVDEDLINLREDDQGNKLVALALFEVPSNGSWETFTLDEESEIMPALQNPTSKVGKADWELALVETISNLSKPKTTLGGGLNPLFSNSMNLQGMMSQHTSTSQFSSGSASNVTIPGPGKGAWPVLAIPALDGTLQNHSEENPFVASFSVPAPSYVQMSDMEKKQQLLVHEQRIWNHNATSGMQSQASLAKIAPYEMLQGGYHYAP